MSQQRRPEQWSPLGGDVGAAPMPTEPPSPTQRQDHAWQQYAMRPSDQAADIPYPPLAARDYYHNRSMSSATHADAAERAAAFQTAAAAAARSRSATQPSQPRPTTPLDWARYVPPARGYPQSTVPTRLPVRVPQETRDDARVRAIVQALRVDPQGVPATAGEMQQQEQQRQQQQQPSRQPSVMELRPMPSTLRTNPQQWYAGLPPRPSQAAAAAAPSPELLESRPGMTQRQTALSPLNTATSTAPTFGKPEPTAMTATDTAVGSAPSTAGWPTKETVGYVEGAADGPRVLATMGDDGGRGGGVAYAENKRVGTAGAVELDKNVVTWDGPDDPANPANWSMSRKYKTSLILSLFSFIAPFSATMVGPAIDVIGAELEIAPAARQLIQGMQVLAAGIGPFFIAPMVEVYGRADVIRYSHLWHLIWNTACGFSTTGGQLLAFRFVGGLGASAPQILAPGLTADVYPAHMGGRGDAVHAYLPFFGSAIAPIFGAFVSQESNWRWIFWGTSIFSLVAIILAFVALDETYHAVLLERKAARLRKETGNQRLHTPFHPPDMSQRTNWLLKRAALPWIMLVSHPIVQLPFGYRAYLFGIMYLIISTFDRNFMDFYGMDRGSASLNYLALGIGFVVGLHISRYAIDGVSSGHVREGNVQNANREWPVFGIFPPQTQHDGAPARVAAARQQRRRHPPAPGACAVRLGSQERAALHRRGPLGLHPRHRPDPGLLQPAAVRDRVLRARVRGERALRRRLPAAHCRVRLPAGRTARHGLGSRLRLGLHDAGGLHAGRMCHDAHAAVALWPGDPAGEHQGLARRPVGEALRRSGVVVVLGVVMVLAPPGSALLACSAETQCRWNTDVLLRRHLV
ncbi:hypothetical protein RB595_004418 [Gaeumannomyces hyphopodioides]